MSTQYDDRRDADERMLDLLADRALFGLDAAEARELDALLRSHEAGMRDEFERLAAATAVAVGGPAGEMSPDLRARLRDDARRFAGGGVPVAVRSGHPWLPVDLRGGLILMGTVAAAACLFVMVSGTGRDDAPAPGPGTEVVQDPPAATPAVPAVQPARLPTPALQREEMLASVRDAQTLDCVAAGDDDAGQESAGDVVWSDQRRRGFLRVKGLARSEPGSDRYRIWILDGSKGKPISGGVFQVTDGGGEVVVPILPQSPVHGPTMFVVAAEEPGSDGEYDLGRARVVARAD
jgi:hypothetical protein